MSEWTQIEEAPKDGTRVLLFRPGAVDWTKRIIGSWERDQHAKNPRPYWRNDLELLLTKKEARLHQPTHFMPLPAPPPKMQADLCLPWPLAMAKAARRPPLELARSLAESLAGLAEVESAVASPPGFVNLKLRN